MSVPGDTTRTTSRLTRPLAFFGILDLLADGDAEPLADEPGDVAVGGVERHAAHRNRAAAGVLRPGGERQLERARGGQRVLVEHLVEIAHAEEDDGVAVLTLGVEVLAHRRGRPGRLGEDRGGHRARVADWRTGGEPAGASITLSRHVLVLALDTTNRAGSVAVVNGGVLVGGIAGDPSRTYGERLPRDLMRVLAAAAIPLEAVDLLAVAAGPGSFTGLRVGIAAMQGLAMATGRKIVPVSALDALAAAGADSRRTCPWPPGSTRSAAKCSRRCTTAGARASCSARPRSPRWRRSTQWGSTPGWHGPGLHRRRRHPHEAAIRERSARAHASWRRRWRASSAGWPPPRPTVPCCLTRSCRSTCAGRTSSWRGRGAPHDLPRAGGMLIERISEAQSTSTPSPRSRRNLHQPVDPGNARARAAPVRCRPRLRGPAARLPLAAFCVCWLVDDELHINTIAVDARHRRQGLATA